MTATASSRIRLTKPVVATRADAERILGEIAAKTAARNGLRAGLDEELTAVRQKYEGRIDGLSNDIEEKSGLLQQWAEENSEEFGNKKSVEFLHGRIGFRTGTPKLKTLAGWTWDKVKGVLDSTFIRTKSEPDKELLLASYARGEITDATLRGVGVKVVQDEAFFVEPKIEEGAS
jgi:phage host-nuclease inhibitor protein Gam